MSLEDACYDAAYWMRATQRRAHRYCRDAGGQLINPINPISAVERHFTTFFSNLWEGAEYNRTSGEWQWLNGSLLPGNGTLLEDACCAQRRRRR